MASFAAFLPVLLAALGVDFASLGITPLASPANYAPYVIYAWLAADRSRIARTGQVFAEPAREVLPD